MEAPLGHAAGAHWGRFVHTIVGIETEDGLVVLGGMGGVGESAEAAVLAASWRRSCAANTATSSTR